MQTNPLFGRYKPPTVTVWAPKRAVDLDQPHIQVLHYRIIFFVTWRDPFEHNKAMD